MAFTEIQEFLQECAENISEVLNLDVTILDREGLRVSGTGAYREFIGKTVPKGSFFEMILESGKPGIIFDTKKDQSECQTCKFLTQCKEVATMGYPIFKKDQIVGVIGVIGFSPEQRLTIMKHSNQLLNFISQICKLLENKLLLHDVYDNTTCQVQEQVELSEQMYSFEQMVGYYTSLVDVIKKSKKVMNSPSTILISGESGTGKEVLAQSIHNGSNRSSGPFVAVNCSAIPQNLIESELFGYEGGAYTGSRKSGHKGKFEFAHKGTIFLDEIGDLPLSMQPKLLRVLQEKRIERVGSNQSIPVDVRVIAATNRNLEAMVREGTFREDLYYRIYVIPLYLKSLRERKEDIPLLIRHFTHKYSKLLQKDILGMDITLEKILTQYDWPGNIRQLENCIEYMVNMADKAILSKHDLPEYIGRNRQASEGSQGKSLEEQLYNFEKGILETYLKNETYQSDKVQLAEELQISMSTLYRKLEKYKLS